MSNRKDVWEKIKISWDKIKAPLRPDEKEVEFVSNQIGQRDNSLILLLGVTPEYANLASSSSYIVSVDSSYPMRDSVWPGNNDFRECHIARWEELGGRISDFDFSIGDGVLTAQRKNIWNKFMQNVNRGLKSRGTFLLRVYLQNSPRKNPDEIIANANSNFSFFKLEFMKSLIDDAGEIPVSLVYKMFKQKVSQQVIDKAGWTKDDLSTIEIYQDLKSSYSFAEEKELLQLFKDNSFEVVEKFISDKEWSGHCPIYALRKTGR